MRHEIFDVVAAGEVSQGLNCGVREMTEAVGICALNVAKRLTDPSEAPKPYMIVMADPQDVGLHYFMDFY